MLGLACTGVMHGRTETQCLPASYILQAIHELWTRLPPDNPPHKPNDGQVRSDQLTICQLQLEISMSAPQRQTQVARVRHNVFRAAFLLCARPPIGRSPCSFKMPPGLLDSLIHSPSGHLGGRNSEWRTPISPARYVSPLIASSWLPRLPAGWAGARRCGPQT